VLISRNAWITRISPDRGGCHASSKSSSTVVGSGSVRDRCAEHIATGGGKVSCGGSNVRRQQ
jgi:hypothetical protein